MTVSKHILLFAFLSISAKVKSEDCVNPETKGSDYTGTVNVTKSGLTCQKWNSQEPHSHSHGVEIGDINFCRNPDNGRTVWCYTIDPDTRWEYCNVSFCDSTNTTTTSSITTDSTDTTDSTATIDPTTTGSPSNCECIGPADNPDVYKCDKPNGSKKCNVRNNQTCPDMYCDKLDRCFSVTACPDVAIPDEMPCEDCTCMDKEDEICRQDPLGLCNLCDNISPRKICRVHADSKCADKYCVNSHRCYAVSACACDKNKPTTTK